jgi:NAD(P)-dependent dehydrogenase (short-subunit alcohol dehydrogenase family)
MDVRGRGILVTGGSDGLGRAVAKELAARGGRVVVVARGQARLHETVEEIRAAGGEAHALALDVGDKDAVHPLAGVAAALVGPIDVVVHAASTLGPLPMPLLLDTACEDLTRVLDVNLVGPFRLTKALAGSMVVRRRGVVLFVTSDASVDGYPTWGAYGVSKAALDHLARIWAAEVASTGVKIFSVDPGEMNTRMHADAFPDADPKTFTDPGSIAMRIAQMIAAADRIDGGARLVAPAWSTL